MTNPHYIVAEEDLEPSVVEERAWILRGYLGIILLVLDVCG